MQKRQITPEFLNIPYALIIDSKLTPLDLKVYGIILWFKNTSKLKMCFVKNSTISLLLSSDERTVTSGAIQNSLARLEKFQYIERLFKDKEKRHRLELKVCDIKSRVSSNDDSGYHHMMIGVSSYDDSRVSSYDDHSNKNKSNKNIDICTPTYFSDKTLLKILKYYSYTISKIATSAKLTMTKKSNKVISEVLKDYEPLDLILAIKGFSESKWQMDKNGFRGVEWFFSDSKRLNQYVGLFNQNCDQAFIKEAKNYLK